MREMKDSGIERIGQIPEDWKTCRLKNYAHICNGCDYASVLDENGKYPVIGSGGEFAKTNTPLYQSESVLLGRKGTVNKPLYIDYPFWTVDTMYYTEIRKDVCTKYFYYLCTQIEFDFYQYGSALPSMTQKDLYNVWFPRPSLDEQYRIASYLDRKCAQIDAIIAKQQQVIDKLKEYKLSIITEAVTKGLDPNVPMKDSGVEWIGMVPEEWKILKLQTHTRMLTPMRDRPEKLDGDIPWIRIEDYDGKYISSSKEGLGVSLETVKEMNLKIYPVGSILCTSSCDLGKCAIVEKEVVSNQRFINIIPDNETSSNYLYYLMLSNAKRLNHLSTGTIQANLSRKAFEHLMVQFPPIGEQQEIAHYLDKECEKIEDVVTGKENIIKGLMEYKKSLIYEVVTGKMEV